MEKWLQVMFACINIELIYAVTGVHALAILWQLSTVAHPLDLQLELLFHFFFSWKTVCG